MTLNQKHWWAIAFGVVVILAFGTLAFGQQPQPTPPSRGPFGLLNWRQTQTYPSVAWPSVPTEHTNALCVTSDNNPGMYPPNGVVATSATPTVANTYDGPTVLGVVLVGLVAGFLLLGGGGRLLQHRRTAHNKFGKKRK